MSHNRNSITYKAGYAVGTAIGAALSILALVGIIWCIAAVWRAIAG